MKLTHSPLTIVSAAAIITGTFTILVSGTALTGAVIGAPSTSALWSGLGLLVAGTIGLFVAMPPAHTVSAADDHLRSVLSDADARLTTIVDQAAIDAEARRVATKKGVKNKRIENILSTYRSEYTGTGPLPLSPAETGYILGTQQRLLEEIERLKTPAQEAAGVRYARMQHILDRGQGLRNDSLPKLLSAVHDKEAKAPAFAHGLAKEAVALYKG